MDYQDSTALIIRSTEELLDLIRDSATHARVTAEHSRRLIDTSREALKNVETLISASSLPSVSKS